MPHIPAMRMHSTSHSFGQPPHYLRLNGAEPIIIESGFALVPYPLVKEAIAQGFTLDPSAHWPPRVGSMSPPEPLNSGDVVHLPDGTGIVIGAPFNQVVDIPERFIRHFEAQGWTNLAKFV